MSIFGNRLRGLRGSPTNAVTGISGWSSGAAYCQGTGRPVNEKALTLSAVYSAVDIRSGSMSVLPAFIMEAETREHVPHELLELLNVRPNEAMTATVRKQLHERSILLTGNSYDWILRDERTRKPKELIPIPGSWVTVWLDENRRPWYQVVEPVTGKEIWLANEDVCHYKGQTRYGYTGISVLEYARTAIEAGLAAQDYSYSYYQNGGRPSGLLETEESLSGTMNVQQSDGTFKAVPLKEIIRKEWEKAHNGAQNSFRVAILDHGLKYTPLSVSNRDAQFVETSQLTVEDVARFFGVPLYKLQAGKQSYNANEQQAIEYMVNLQPRITMMEEEQLYKLLLPSERAKGLVLKYDMTSLMRGDSNARGSFYQKMIENSAYSPNDIRRAEAMPDIEGGDEYRASLNYVPLSDWKQLSLQRNAASDSSSTTGQEESQ